MLACCLAWELLELIQQPVFREGATNGRIHHFNG